MSVTTIEIAIDPAMPSPLEKKKNTGALPHLWSNVGTLPGFGESAAGTSERGRSLLVGMATTRTEKGHMMAIRDPDGTIRNPDGTPARRGWGAMPWVLGALVLAVIVGFFAMGNDGDRTASNTPATTSSSAPATTGSGSTTPPPAAPRPASPAPATTR
jgi:hypothetical protein